MSKPTGAFGGLYNHEVIKNLRAELAKTSIMLAALLEHTGIKEDEFKKVVSEYMTKMERQLVEREKGG